MDSTSTITRWIRLVRNSDEHAARKLWEQYAARLRTLARQWIRSTGPWDEEDIVVSAYQTLFQKLQSGQFVNVDSRDTFWALLTIIAARKAKDFGRRDRALKRGGIRTISLDNANEKELISTDSQSEMDFLITEECLVLIDQLEDPDLKHVALLRLEGLSNQEIAEQLKFSQRSVQRIVKLIKEIWEKKANG